MALADFPKRFASPIFGRQLEPSLWLLQREQKLIIVDPCSRENWAFATIMPEGIGERFRKCFLQKLRINIQHRVAELNVPGDFPALLWEIVLNLRPHIFHEIGGSVRNQRRRDLPDCSGKPL